MNCKITQEKEEWILSNLNLTNKKIAKFINMTEGGVEQFFKRKGIVKGRRVICVNESYFENIDSPNKAYILGLIYADGWNNVSGNRWGVQLTETDSYILSEIAKEIGYEGSLKTLKPSCPNGRPRTRLEVCSKKMCSDLLNLGIKQNKSLVLDFDRNIFCQNLLPHFFRGVFDGDGSLYIKDNKVCITITSSTLFCETSSYVIKDNIGYMPKVRLYKKNPKSADLRFFGRGSAKKFLNWIYDEDSQLKLLRKFDKYLTL